MHRGRAHSADKRARRLIEQGNLEEARAAVELAQATLDRAAQKGVIHKNRAARRKSRLMKQLNELEQAS
jgi:small subunit ribosomal protein S20